MLFKGLIVTIFCAVILSSCASVDSMINDEEPKLETPTNPNQSFIDLTQKCTLGDLSHLDEILSQYRQSLIDRSMRLQKYKETSAFELCIQKASFMHDDRAQNAIIKQPIICAIISRYFYIQDDPINGSFWMQRVINLQGEVDGYYTLGKIFIQRSQTIAIGANFLLEASRLGNVQAQQNLIDLANPGSFEYQRLIELKDK